MPGRSCRTAAPRAVVMVSTSSSTRRAVPRAVGPRGACPAAPLRQADHARAAVLLQCCSAAAGVVDVVSVASAAPAQYLWHGAPEWPGLAGRPDRVPGTCTRCPISASSGGAAWWSRGPPRATRDATGHRDATCGSAVYSATFRPSYSRSSPGCQSHSGERSVADGVIRSRVPQSFLRSPLLLQVAVHTAAAASARYAHDVHTMVSWRLHSNAPPGLTGAGAQILFPMCPLRRSHLMTAA